jgi:hypothetical protein
MYRRHGSCLFLSALLCVITVGCGGSGEEVVRARGKVTNAGQPLQVEGRDLGLGMVKIELYPIGDDGQQSTNPEGTVADADGSFEVPGRDGNGIPPGKYRIVLRQWDPYPQVDKLKGRFDEQNSQIVREITGKEEILIDVSKPEG